MTPFLIALHVLVSIFLIAVVLLQRGACSFFAKASNAEAAGAEAVLVFNQGNGEDRSGLFLGTLGGSGVTIPAFSLDFPTGAALVADPSEDVDLTVQARTEETQTENVVADLPGRNTDNHSRLNAKHPLRRHLFEEVPKHQFGNVNVSYDAILKRPNRLDRLRGPTKHSLGFKTDGHDATGTLLDSHDRRFV